MFTKTTLNYANKRKLDLTVWDSIEDGDDRDSVAIWEYDNEMEPLCVYTYDKGQYFFSGNLWLPKQVKEELPYYVKDEKHLRQVLKFISENI